MKDETLEEKMEHAAFGSGLVETVDAVKVAREHAEARVGPLVRALERCRKTLAKYCPEDGSVYGDCIEDVDAVLAAEQAHAAATETQDAGCEPGSEG